MELCPLPGETDLPAQPARTPSRPAAPVQRRSSAINEQTPEPTKATTEWSKNLVNSSESLRRDGNGIVVENGGSQLGEKPHGKNNTPRPAAMNPPASRRTCSICQAKCSSELDFQKHLGGRRHRENKEALRAKSRSLCGGKDAEMAGFEKKESGKGKTADKKGAHFCSVQCNSEKMPASHLGGRRHREMLEGCE
ncbi:uncharacterized protein LOC133896960 [Phragmites australis]|uniref:uncharacterized protein LOC133896960 n=1 Tax=Phragmites australis TaxID=29695 RepID=UPI002D7874E1|nr:uncharacterized protein LOC133896960 [Phragmites australis]